MNTKGTRRFLSWAVAAAGLVAATVMAGLADAPQSSSQRTDEAGMRQAARPAVTAAVERVQVVRDGEYTSKDEVAAFVRKFGGALPRNFITKREARALGWQGGPLEPYAPGKSIGGDRFGNYEGQLPTEKGRKYFECDIDFDGTFRNAKRIIFSNDGLIFYTEDHYTTFEEIE
jgi:guanyl-specific ribonuclease Sa